MPAPSEAEFLLCDYFNVNGRQIERIYIATNERDDAADKLRRALGDHSLDLLVDVMKAEANISDATTSIDDAALALNALLNEIAERRVAIGEACRITSVSVNFHKSVSVADVMPALETTYGGYAVSWARGIFQQLNLGAPYIH